MVSEASSPETAELLSTLFTSDYFIPAEPDTLEHAGLSEPLVESLVCKYLSSVGTASGREIAGHLHLPFRCLEPTFKSLRNRQIIAYRGAAALNDYEYLLTEQGRDEAHSFFQACSYNGPAPVPLVDYVVSVDAQSITMESPKAAELAQAFKDIVISPDMFARLGPAINSGAGLFLYGAPGNGKTTLAEMITRCFGQHIWIPAAILAEGEIIKLYDPAYHEVVQQAEGSLLNLAAHDRRWLKIHRPTVIAGGELTLDALEIRHDHHAHVSEAPLQMKSNCGTLLIDDFGRQRVDPVALLNRWIVPLEKRFDFLTLASGKKIQIPFDQLIVFSTNLEPRDLVDEAFLRRIPYKIRVEDPDDEEFQLLFEHAVARYGCECSREAVEYLLEKHYRKAGRAKRRCHPRDLLAQIRNDCVYRGVPLEVTPENLDRAVQNYFTVIG